MPGRRTAGFLVGLVLTSVLALPSAANATTRVGLDPHLANVTTFAFALGGRVQSLDRLDQLAQYDLVVVDGEQAPRALVDGLHNRGVVVLGYLSVGTIERHRGWTRAAKPYRLDHWDDWDEWFAETADPGFRGLITDTVAPSILARGFDGLFLDNIDMISAHPRQRDGMNTLVHALAELTHAHGGVVFAQNGEDVINPMLDALDGWNREDVTSTYSFETGRYRELPDRDVLAADRALRRIHDRGLLVTATDYVARGDAESAARATRNACSAGALSYVSDIGLNRMPAEPPRCSPSGG